MSIFRVFYRQGAQAPRPSEEIDAVEFIQREPWIVFLDATGACLSIRSEDVERIERVRPPSPVVEPPPGPPSDPPLPAV